MVDLTGLGSLFDFGSKVLERIFPDPKDRLDAQQKLLELQQTGELAKLASETELAKGQLSINQEEARSGDKFASRWRPMIGYICGFAFAYKFVVQPFLIFILVSFGSNFDYHKLPELNWAEMSPVLLGLLGLGGMRSYEKKNGVSGK